MVLDIKENTINLLTRKFDRLLCGTDTKKLKFENKAEKERIINSIKSFVSYRLKENIIDNKSELWKILRQILKLDFSSKKNIERIYL